MRLNLKIRIQGLLFYPWAYTKVSYSSGLCWLKSLTKSNQIVFENEYQGQPILLCAIFEKGELRNDVENMLNVAKRRGAYILCVNTGKLERQDKLEDLIDCYIERFNFGRDFGSYKAGFQHLIKRRWEQTCPRVLMLNDSVFYSKNNLEEFIDNLFSTEKDVLGATENHEIQHHLGSFCISISKRVLQNELFQKFWNKYSCTDMRPKVIKHGEMELSKILKRCAYSDSDFSAMYGGAWFSELVTEANENTKDSVSAAIKYARNSDRVGWPRFSLEEITFELNKSMYRQRYLFEDTGLHTVTLETADHTPNSRDTIAYDLIRIFLRGSQIHQNASFLHYSGLPIIKIDLLYRGMFNEVDVEKTCEQLDRTQVAEFKKLIYSKPFGGFIHVGTKLAAFNRGLI